MDQERESQSYFGFGENQTWKRNFSIEQIRDLWSDKSMIEEWLLVERTLAEIEGELEIIPSESVLWIKKAAVFEAIDPQKESIGIPNLVKQVIEYSETLGDKNGFVRDYLHWGATTQDIQDCGMMRLIRKNLLFNREQIQALLSILLEIMERHKKTLMVGRSNATDALPYSFGLQISSYINELNRHLDRLDRVLSEATIGIFGGALGTFASLTSPDGKNLGLEVRDRLMKRLDLISSKGVLNSSLDHWVEIVQWTARVHGTLLRIGRNITLQNRDFVGEVTETPSEESKSSTMPQKRNPRLSNALIGFAKMGFMFQAGALEFMDQEDVRSTSSRHNLHFVILPETFLILSKSLDKAKTLFQGLKVSPERMLENFEANQYRVLSESLMMKLASKVGRERGYQLSQQVAERSLAEGTSYLKEAKSEREIADILSERELEESLDPYRYLGLCEELLAETRRETLKRLKDLL